MGDYSFGPGPKGWYTLLILATLGVLSIAIVAVSVVVYLYHHLRFVN